MASSNQVFNGVFGLLSARRRTPIHARSWARIGCVASHAKFGPVLARSVTINLRNAPNDKKPGPCKTLGFAMLDVKSVLLANFAIEPKM
jgi:hypothetical protein